MHQIAIYPIYLVLLITRLFLYVQVRLLVAVSKYLTRAVSFWNMQLEYAAGICSWNMPERSNHTIVRQTIPRYRNDSKMLQD